MTTLGASAGSSAAAAWRPHGPLHPDETLHFLHIPKTAGRSVRAVLQNHFDWADACPGTVLPDLLDKSSAELDQWRLFCGHYGRYIHRLLSRTPVEITFLRDPIERSVSHYRDLKTREGTWLHAFVNSHTFDEFVLDPVASTELMNLQTRYLALDDIDADFFGYSRQRDSDLEALIEKIAGEELLARAIENLNAMAFVGLQERFEDSMSLLHATFGWSVIRETPRHNTAKTPFDRDSISERAMDRLCEITALDQSLYEAASARFDRDWAAVRSFGLDRAYAEHMSRRPRVSGVSFGFERAFEGRGWYDRERWPDGVVHRWTGPSNTATMDLPLESGCSYRVRFRAGAKSNEVVAGAELFVDGVRLEGTSWPLQLPETSRRVFDLVLPRGLVDAQNTGGTRLEFRVPATVCPADTDADSKDTRRLGLCFDWLEIFPLGGASVR